MMKFINYILKYLLVTLLFTLHTIANSTLTGNVIEVDVDSVIIDVEHANTIPIESKVKLYYKTSFGQKMDVGEWQVVRTSDTIVYAEPINMISKPMVGLEAVISLSKSAQECKMSGSKEEQNSLKNKSHTAKEYIDDTYRLADDLEKNYESYSKQEISKMEATIIDNVHKALALDYAEAYYILALLYQNGYGELKSDMNKMVENLTKSAERGFVKAQYILGEMYKDGDEVVKDREQAIFWLKKAAERGHKDAKYELKKLMNKK